MMIQAENVWKQFGRHEVLKGLNLNVAEGSAYALIGPNGAGKTTTIRLLMNLLEPASGRATVLGVDSRKISPALLAQIGYVSENQKFPGRLTVDEYIAYLRPFYPTWDRALESSITAQLGLPGRHKIKALSHGMRIKLALACALPYRPRLLILDEPFSGLDPLVRDEFMSGLLQQAGELTVLISSHELAELEGTCTHVGFMDAGKMLIEESMEALGARFREVRVTLEQPATVPSRLPPEWLQAEAMGNVLRFIETRFSEADLAARVQATLGAVKHVDAEPMPLRSVFTTLARAARNNAKQG